jgi:hypothetical protein
MSSAKVFICYAREDINMAKKLYADLKHNGIDVWLDIENLLPGENWKQKISDAIRQSSYIMALISSHSISKKGFVQKELRLALDILDELPPSEIFLIPVRLEENVNILDERLASLQWLDLFRSYEDGLKTILRVLHPIKGKSTTISNRLQRRIKELNEQYDLLSEKYSLLRRSVILETDSATKFKLNMQIEELESERKKIEGDIEVLERQMHSDIFSQSPHVETKIRDRLDQSITDILSKARQLASISELAQLSTPNKQFLASEIGDLDSAPAGVVILKFRELANLAKNYNQISSSYMKNKELMKLMIALRGLQNNQHIQGYWYADSIRELSETWLLWAEQEAFAKQHKASQEEIPNPFWYGNPISPDHSEVFVGRWDVIEKIERMLFQKARITLFLFGRRRTGKSSTLLNLNRFLDRDNITCVYIDLQGLLFRESDYAFCINTSKEIVKLLPQMERVFKKLDFSDNPFSTFYEFLDNLESFAEEHNKRILLTFDEYERLDADNKNILDTLRSVIQHRTRIITLVAGAHRFSEVKKSKNVAWSDYLINTKTVEIGYLDRQSAYKLLTNPIEGFDVDFPEDIPEKILNFTHCQPYLLQAFGSELVDYLNLQRRKIVRPGDFDIVCGKVLTAADVYFENIWDEECSLEERNFLKHVMSDGESNFEPNNEIARSLLKKEILEKQNGYLKIAIPLVEFWIKKKQLMLQK